MLRENELHGAFANPGSISGQAKPTIPGNAPQTPPSVPPKSDATKSDATSGDNPALHSPPIKVDLIGTPEDGQLKAALAQLERKAAN